MRIVAAGLRWHRWDHGADAACGVALLKWDFEMLISMEDPCEALSAVQGIAAHVAPRIAAACTPCPGCFPPDKE